MKILLFILLVSSLQAKYKEKHYQTKLCNKLNGVIEYKIKDVRIDCLTDDYAIESDFSKKWAESIGQSLYYAHLTGKKPAIHIILKDKNDKHLHKLLKMEKLYDIKIFIDYE